MGGLVSEEGWSGVAVLPHRPRQVARSADRTHLRAPASAALAARGPASPLRRFVILAIADRPPPSAEEKTLRRRARGSRPWQRSEADAEEDSRHTLRGRDMVGEAVETRVVDGQLLPPRAEKCSWSTGSRVRCDRTYSAVAGHSHPPHPARLVRCEVGAIASRRRAQAGSLPCTCWLFAFCLVARESWLPLSLEAFVDIGSECPLWIGAEFLLYPLILRSARPRGVPNFRLCNPIDGLKQGARTFVLQ